MTTAATAAAAAAAMNTTKLASSKARSQLSVILKYYVSINPNVRRWGCMALYMWWAVYSTYRGVIKPKNKAAAKAKAAGKALEAGTQDKGKSATSTSASAVATVPPEPVSSATSKRSRRGGRRGPRVEVDAVFFERLSRILAIVLPTNKRKLILESFFLVFRVGSGPHGQSPSNGGMQLLTHVLLFSIFVDCPITLRRTFRWSDRRCSRTRRGPSLSQAYRNVDVRRYPSTFPSRRRAARRYSLTLVTANPKTQNPFLNIVNCTGYIHQFLPLLYSIQDSALLPIPPYFLRTRTIPDRQYVLRFR